jgi:hypothetical protein
MLMLTKWLIFPVFSAFRLSLWNFLFLGLNQATCLCFVWWCVSRDSKPIPFVTLDTLLGNLNSHPLHHKGHPSNHRQSDALTVIRSVLLLLKSH